MSTCGTCRFWGGDATRYSGACGLGVALGAPTFDAAGCAQHQAREAPPTPTTEVTGLAETYERSHEADMWRAAEMAVLSWQQQRTIYRPPARVSGPVPGCDCPDCQAGRRELAIAFHRPAEPSQRLSFEAELQLAAPIAPPPRAPLPDPLLAELARLAPGTYMVLVPEGKQYTITVVDTMAGP